MVRKVMVTACMLALVFALGVQAQAATHEVYDGNPSNTYITYYKDIISGLSLTEHYIVFRSGQNEYIMVTGDLAYENGTFSLQAPGKAYRLYNEGSYNSYYRYSVTDITDFSVSPGDRLVYSDLGVYPQLEDRGIKYEILTTIIISALCLGFVCRVFFSPCKR